MKRFITLVLCAFQAGCAAMDGVAPTELTRTTKLTSFTLKSDVIGEMTSTNAFGTKTTYATGLRKGKYISVFVDKEGTYYQGEKDCLYNSVAYYKYLDGGVWIPNKDSKEEPRFWFYLKRLQLFEFNAGVLDVALANMNAGNVKKELSTKIEAFLLNQISVQDE